MCVVSMIMENYYDKWRRYIQPPNPWPWQPVEPFVKPTVPPPVFIPNMPTQEEIDDFRRLYEKAKEYDKTHNQPDCELDEKKQKLLKLAEELGIKDKVKFL